MTYLERAQKFGHDTEALERGETVSTLVSIADIHEYRELLAGSLTEDHRADFNADFDPEVAADADKGPLYRLMHYVYGTYALTGEDTAYANSVFPISIQATSAADHEITSDVTYGPAAAPVAINAGTLTFNGGAVTAITTSLTITADTLEVIKGGSKQYIVGILGSKGAPGDQGVPGPAFQYPAKNGNSKSPTSPGICAGVGNGDDGDPGLKGNPGEGGGDGLDGVTNMPANITITKVGAGNVLPFVLYTQSGAGGPGGAGGKGGTGQNGGNGGNGCDSGCQGTNGGDGGDAGEGGNGGLGGNGGNGVPGTAILGSFPKANKDDLEETSDVALAGDAGLGGEPGQPGTPGQGGSGGKDKSDGVIGGGNKEGEHGHVGNPGTRTGAAGRYSINYI